MTLSTRAQDTGVVEIVYQGSLTGATGPANGTFDFEFSVFDAASEGEMVSVATTNRSVTVRNGLFTTGVPLARTVFDGSERWLQIGVRTNGGAAFVALSPRQRFGRTPYALHSDSAATIDSQGIQGVVADQQIPGNVARLNQNAVFEGTVFAEIFYGDGSGLTNLTGLELAITNGDTRDILLNGAFSAGTFLGTNGIVTATVRSNSWVFGDPERPSGQIHVKDGAIWMPSAKGWADYYGTNTYQDNKWAGGLHWQGLLGVNQNEPYGDDVHSTEFAKLQAYFYWGGSNTFPRGNPWVILTAPHIRLEEGYAGYSPFNSQIHIGNEDHFGSIVINYTPIWNVDGSYSNNILGRSHPVTFGAIYVAGDGSRYYAAPGIQSRAVPSPIYFGPEGNQVALGELWFYAGTPIPASKGVDSSWEIYPGVMVGRMLTNGWDLRGKMIEEKITRSGEVVAIDFNAARNLDVLPNGPTTTFYLTNQTPGVTNIERKVLRIFSRSLSANLRWPEGITVVSESGTAGLPPVLPAHRVARITFESSGLGATNVLAMVQTGVDYGFAYDAAATNFYGRATVTNEVDKAALDSLVKELKLAGVWNKLHAVYPFVGGTAAAHSQNLVSGAYAITWSGGVTHGANGVTGNGVNGWGNTGYQPRLAGQTNSMHLSVYSRTPAATGHLLSVADPAAGTFRASLGVAGGFLDGQLNQSFQNCNTATMNDFSGFLAVSRLSATELKTYVRAGTVQTCYPASSGLPGNNLYLLARNFTGYTPDNVSNANLAFASVGEGLTEQEVASLRVAVEHFQTALGR